MKKEHSSQPTGSPHPLLLPSSTSLCPKINLVKPNIVSAKHVPMLTFVHPDWWLFQTFRPCHTVQVKSTNQHLPASPWPRQMTTLGTTGTTSSPLSAQLMQQPKWNTCMHCKAVLSSGMVYNPQPRALNVILNLLAGPTSLQPLMPAFPSSARCRVSRHLFKSANFRPLLPSAAFLVTVEYCQRQNRPWFDCKFELAQLANSFKSCHSVMMLLESFSSPSQFSPHIKIFSPHLPARDLPTVTAPCISVPWLVQNSSLVQTCIGVPLPVQNSSSMQPSISVLQLVQHSSMVQPCISVPISRTE